MMMFKALNIQILNNLNDSQREPQITERMSFKRFYWV